VRSADRRRDAASHARLLDGLRVLLVDDHPDTPELLARVLGSAGAQLDVVRTVQEAIDAVQGDPPSVLISDMIDPASSNRLIRHVRALQRGADFPAIVISAFSWEEHRATAVAAGFDEWLSRPAINSVVDAVARLTGRG
jgi:CheY-like chemotaxis protein